MDESSKLCFDSQLICQGLNLNKILIYTCIFIFSLFLPLYLDEQDALSNYGLFEKPIEEIKSGYTSRIGSYSNGIYNRKYNTGSAIKTPVGQRGYNLVASIDSESQKSNEGPVHGWKEPRSDFDLAELAGSPDPVFTLELVFLPLVIWQAVALFGGIFGIFVYIIQRRQVNRYNNGRQAMQGSFSEHTNTSYHPYHPIQLPSNRTNSNSAQAGQSTTPQIITISNASKIDFSVMLIHCISTISLLIFELLVYIKLTQPNIQYLYWILVFSPLLLMTPPSILACIWAFHRQKFLELEPALAIGSIQFVFIALKLDNILNWTWLVVAIPSWVIILLVITCFFAVLCHISIAYFRRGSTSLHDFDSTGQGRPNMQYLKPAQILSTFLLILIPTMLFLIMLVVRLDSPNIKIHWIVIFTPLIVSISLVLFLQCCTINDSKWWFGIRQDYCTFFLYRFPKLRQYANFAFYTKPQTTSSRRTRVPNITVQEDDEISPSNANPDSSHQTTRSTSAPRNSRLFSRMNFLSRKQDSLTDTRTGNLPTDIPLKYDLASPD